MLQRWLRRRLLHQEVLRIPRRGRSGGRAGWLSDAPFAWDLEVEIVKDTLQRSKKNILKALYLRLELSRAEVGAEQQEEGAGAASSLRWDGTEGEAGRKNLLVSPAPREVEEEEAVVVAPPRTHI